MKIQEINSREQRKQNTERLFWRVIRLEAGRSPSLDGGHPVTQLCAFLSISPAATAGSETYNTTALMGRTSSSHQRLLTAASALL